MGVTQKLSLVGILFVLSVVCVISAQQPPNLVVVSYPVHIYAQPQNITLNETSLVVVKVFYPKLEELGEFSGTPAVGTKVIISTESGTLIELNTSNLEITNNTGSEITAYTNESGVVLALFEPNEVGNFTITVMAPEIESIINTIKSNATTAYVVRNYTHVLVSEAIVTTPTPEETTTPERTPTPEEISTPIETPTQTPEEKPTPTATPKETQIPTPTPTPVLTSTPEVKETPEKTPTAKQTPEIKVTPKKTQQQKTTETPVEEVTPVKTPEEKKKGIPGFEAFVLILALLVLIRVRR